MNMDYKEKYEQALERAGKELASCGNGRTKMLQRIFPELKKSEDERIRKGLIHAVSGTLKGNTLFGTDVTREEALSWLEKQGKQIFANSAKTCKDACEEEKGKSALEAFKDVVDNSNKVESKDYNSIDPHFGKPIDKYEGLTDFERTLADICIGWIGEELGWKQYIKDNADVLLKIAIEKFNSVQDTPFEQKSAWSEEDDEQVNIITSIVQAHCGKLIDCRANLKWLKSLKQRIGK